MLENRVFRSILGPKRDEVREEWRKVHNGKHSNVYCSSKFVWVIQLKSLRGQDM